MAALGTWSQCLLESQISGWLTVACPASGDFENSVKEQPTQAMCSGRGSLCLVPFAIFGDRDLRIQILSLVCEYILCQSPKQGTEHISIPTECYLLCVCFFKFHQDRHLYKELLWPGILVIYIQWIHIFQNLCSGSHISLNACFWMKGLFNLPTQCECTRCLLQWRSCSWRYISDNNFDFLLFEM